MRIVMPSKAAAFELLQDDSFNIFKGMPAKIKAMLRKQIIDAVVRRNREEGWPLTWTLGGSFCASPNVMYSDHHAPFLSSLKLGTDMKQHFAHVSLFNTKFASSMPSNGSNGGSAGASLLQSMNYSNSGSSSNLPPVMDEEARSLVLQVGPTTQGSCLTIHSPF